MNPSKFIPNNGVLISDNPTISYEVEVPPYTFVRLEALIDNMVVGAHTLSNPSEFIIVREGTFTSPFQAEFTSMRYLILPARRRRLLDKRNEGVAKLK
ncbi:hypothetical protein WAG19_29085 [Bacillus cereus]|uniref:hypothetical protein n=1 Tax=Bacillus cereus TaxID=1396 RepID=UPI003012AE68